MYQNKEKEKLRIAQEEKMMQEWREKKAKEEALEAQTVLSQIQALNADELKSLLFDCERAVIRHAHDQNKGPFGVALIDEYTSDILIARAEIGKAGSTTPIEDRVKQYLKSEGPATLIDSTFPVLNVHDSFSGPVREIIFYKCEYAEGPRIKRVNRDY